MSKFSPPEIFTCIDLELNQLNNKPKIIEIGVCVLNINTGEILHKKSIYVNPKEKLTPFITELTGIKQETVDNGISVIEAYNELTEIHKKYKSFINPVTWGNGDLDAIRKEVFTPWNRLLNKFWWIYIADWSFGRRIIDVKTLYIAYRLSRGEQLSGGLAKAMTKFGLKFSGRKHNGADDAANTGTMLIALLKLWKK